MKRYGSKCRPRRCWRRVSERFKTAPFSNGFELPGCTGSFRKLSLSCLFVSSESKREKEALLRSKKVCELTCLLEASWALWRPKCCCCARTAARHYAPVRYRVSLSEPNRRIIAPSMACGRRPTGSASSSATAALPGKSKETPSAGLQTSTRDAEGMNASIYAHPAQ